MVNMRKRYDSKFRAKVALDAVKGEKTLAELSNEFGVHANQIGRWSRLLTIDEQPPKIGTLKILH